MRRNFVARRDMCGICFSIVPTMKVPVHKIPSCFAICNVEFLNHSYLTLYANSSVIASRADDADTSVYCTTRINDFLGDMSDLVPIPPSFSSVNTCLVHVRFLSIMEPVA